MTRKIIWVGLLLRLLVAVWNGFFGPSYGAQGDAAGFHEMAVAYTHGVLAQEFAFGYLYAYALGAFYWVTTDSLFLGSALSCLAWLGSAWTLMAVMRLVCVQRVQEYRAMRIYSLLPSAILFTGVTLREPYQLLAVNLVMYSSLRIYLKKSTRSWLVLVFAALGGGMMHGALLGFGILVIAGTSVVLLYRKRHALTGARLALTLTFAALVLVFGFSVFTNLYSYSLEEGLAAAIESYQRGGLSIPARTHYRDTVMIPGASGLVQFIPVSLFKYLFEPMPWRVSAVADVVPLLENMLRAWLIWKAVAGARRLPSERRRPVLIVVASYVLLETIWSIGTVNWGTAARHHIPSMGLLVVSAFAYARRRPRRANTPHVTAPVLAGAT